MPCLLLVGSHPDLPQMLSCTWMAGVPALTLIPHTESTSFAAAAQAFADLHYATSTAQLATPATGEDFGHKISRAAETLAACRADGAGEKVRGPRVARDGSDDIGEAVSRAKTLRDSSDDIGEAISRARVARDGSDDIGEAVSRGLASGGSCMQSGVQTATTVEDTGLGQAVGRPGRSGADKSGKSLSAGAVELPGEASVPTTEIAASASVVPAASPLLPQTVTHTDRHTAKQAQGDADTCGETEQEAGRAHGGKQTESGSQPVEAAEMLDRLRGAPVIVAEQGSAHERLQQLASPVASELLVFEDRWVP